MGIIVNQEDKNVQYTDLGLAKRTKILLALAWPLIISYSFWNLQMTIDRIFIGDYSTIALGAAMSVMAIFWVPMALLQGTANYVMTFVAQYRGAKEEAKIGAAFWQAIYVSFIGGLLIVGLNAVSEILFNLLGHPEATRVLEVEYVNSITWSALPTALVVAVSGYFIGLEKTRVVIFINFLGLALNAVFDWLLIFGNAGIQAFGIAGAGYATAIAGYGSAIFGLFLVFNEKKQRYYRVRRDWKLQLILLKQFLKYGIPSGLQWALEGLAFAAFLVIIGQSIEGEAALAASSICVTIMMLSVLPSMGVAQAVMTLVGRYIGEKNIPAAQRVTWDGVLISLIYIATVGLSFILVPEFYLSWFHNEENLALWSQVEILTPTILAIVAFFTLFDSAYLNISFALKGAGDTRFVSLVALLVPWPLMVLPAWLLRQNPNATVLAWMCAAIYAVVCTFVLVWRFRLGKWQSMSVIHGSKLKS